MSWRRVWPWLLAAACYTGLTILQTWPLVARLPSVIPNDLGDPVLNTWIVWWNSQAVPLTSHWWNGPIFWPSTGALAFSETLLGLAPVTNPIQWLGGSPVTAYNVAFLLTFPLSALAMHALVFRLTSRHDAAVVGALIFGFNPFRVSHFPQIQVMTAFWMPIALYALHGFVKRRDARSLWLFAIAWVMQALSNGYYLLFFPLLLGVWTLWFAFGRDRIRLVASIAAAWIGGTLLLLPYLWQYRHILAAYGMHRGASAGDAGGADVTSLLDAAPLIKFWKVQGFHQSEGELFPGVTAVFLACLLIAVWFWQRRSAPASAPRVSRVFAALGVVFVAAGLSTVFIGPWALRIGSVTLISARFLDKPFTIGLACIAVALAFDPRFAAAWRRRSTVLFYLLATALMYLLSFGPQPKFLGTQFLTRSPYSWLLALPGYDDVRVPARFAMLAALCLAVAAALSLARLSQRLSPKTRALVVSVVIAGVLADNWIDHLPLPPVPVRLQTLEALPAGTAVLELPIGPGREGADDFAAMYRGMFHHRPLVNGYSGFFPRSFDVLAAGLTNGDATMFDAVTSWGPVAVVVDERSESAKVWIDQITARAGTVALGSEAGRRFFLLAPGTPPPAAATQTSTPLPIEHISANVNPEIIRRAIDGDPATRWESGPQRGIEIVTVDLGTARTVDAITMTLGAHASDSPRMLVVESSLDGQSWSVQWQGPTAALAFAGAIRNAPDLPVTIPLPHAAARWLRLRQTGQDRDFYWSIVELSVAGQ